MASCWPFFAAIFLSCSSMAWIESSILLAANEDVWQPMVN